jgi:glycosyltransferase involved in cell wall biosynthesis
MRIAVNTRLLLRNRLDGLGTFAHETLKRITTAHPEHRFYFFFDRKFGEEFIYGTNVIPVVIPPQARHPVLFYVWFEWMVASKLAALKPDLFLSPDGYLSLRAGVPQLPVLHDLNFLHFPEYFSPAVRRHYFTFFPKYANKAARIATVSEFSKQDIIKQFDVESSKIDVVFNGVDPGVFSPVSEQRKREIREELTGGVPYFVFIGSIYPRKNLVRLVQAYGIFREQTSTAVKLVLVGKPYREVEELQNAISSSEYSSDIILAGRIDPPSKMRDILGAALALTYVSTFEGFGIPILEAMSSGVPVIAAANTAMPEVGGDVPVYVDAFNPASIAEGMKRLVGDPQLADIKSMQGIERAKKYTWDQTAALLWQSAERTIHG